MATERKWLAHFIDSEFDTTYLYTRYVRLGDDLEEYTEELNPDVETKKNILGENSVVHSGYEVSSDVDTFYYAYDNELAKKIMDIAMERKTGNACRTTKVDVLLKPNDDDEPPTVVWAYREDIMVVPNSAGGDTSGIQTPFTIYSCGNRVKGTFNLDTKIFVETVDDVPVNTVYGVEVDFENKKFSRLSSAMGLEPGEQFNSVRAFGGRRRCNLTDDGRVAAYNGETGFSTTGKLTQRIDKNSGGQSDAKKIFESGTAVQVMVEQPKFYYKIVPLKLEAKGTGYILRKARYYVCDTPREGFKLHPAFIENGRENDKIYLSAFEGTLWDSSASKYILDDAQVADFETDRLSSVADAKPASGSTQDLTRANARKLANNRGTGWEQSYIATISATQLLMLIEYASFDMQNAIGNGNVSKSWQDDSVNYAENTGATVSLGNKSGAVNNSNSIQMVSYRGEENVWGNIASFVDGINLANSDSVSVYIADHNFSDGSDTSHYKQASISPASKDGFVSAFCYSDEFDYLFIPGETGGNSALPVGDHFGPAKSSGALIFMFGGMWSVTSAAGAFWLRTVSAQSQSYPFGGRLVYIPSKNARKGV